MFEAKDRPRFNPLIVHVPTLDAAEALVAFDERARMLGDRFWPGPLTLVLPRRADSGLSLLVSAGLETVAVRVPNHPTAAAFLRACGRPVAAPSANPSGRISPTTAAHVLASLGGRIDAVIDGGATPAGGGDGDGWFRVAVAAGALGVLLALGGVAAAVIAAIVDAIEERLGLSIHSRGNSRAITLPESPFGSMQRIARRMNTSSASARWRAIARSRFPATSRRQPRGFMIACIAPPIPGFRE